MVQSHLPSPRDLAAKQVDRYLLKLAPPPGSARPQPIVRHQPVITISRALGVPGREIGIRVAHDLGYELFDREVLDVVQENEHLGNRIVESLDEEKQSALDAWIRGWFGTERRVVDSRSFCFMVSRVIRGISLHGAAVVLGRGSNFILKGTDAFRVRLTAPLEIRVRSVAEGVGVGMPMTLSQARAEIERHARDRRSFMRRHFRAEIEDPAAYDAVFTLRGLDPDKAAALIVEAYRLVTGARGMSPRQSSTSLVGSVPSLG